MAENEQRPAAPDRDDQNHDLGRVARLGAKFGAQKKELSDTKKQLGSAMEQIEGLRNQHEQLKKAINDNPLTKQVAELHGRLRETNHKDTFRRIALEKGVPHDRLESAYKLSDYTPQADEPDEATIGAVVENLRATSEFLFAKPAPTPTTSSQPPKVAPPEGQGVKPGPGSGQGGDSKPSITPDIDPAMIGVEDAMMNYNKYIEINAAAAVKHKAELRAAKVSLS